MGKRIVVDRVARVAEFEARIVGLLNQVVDPKLAELAEKYSTKWYQDAHDYAVELSDFFGCSIEQAAGVIAATSIRNRWDQNI